MKELFKKAIKKELGIDLRKLTKREKKIFDILVTESKKELSKDCGCQDDDWLFF